jgi:hypothetical protein
MGVKTDPQCRWVRGRLPLLDGGELTGSDRRRAERHLLTCPACRDLRASVAGALGALRAAAAEAPPALSHDGNGGEAPSLWPALQRQIREAKHEPAPARGFSWSWRWRVSGDDARLDQPIGGRGFDAAAALYLPRRPAVVMAAAMALVVMAAGAVDVWVRWQVAGSEAVVAEAARPLDYEFDLMFPPPAPSLALDRPVMASAFAPDPALSLARADRAVTSAAADRPTGDRLDYDLDHGTPMPPDARDVKPSY